ncbi:MAG: transketolase C-terminal domain-containing protein [Mycobacterium leprae]
MALNKKQVSDFKSGNEMAALAASHINFHMMGYFPITPSTEVAEYIDDMRVSGENTIRMVPADGEHGAAGVCYGAAVAGARVINATSANGYLYALEQMPVQSGTRMPMVLDLVTRAVSGPLDIRGDHSDLYYSLNTGWVVLYGDNPQEVYDLHPIAVKVGEHPEVRLPVIVGYDGFFTSHQKRRVEYFEDSEVMRSWVGPQPEGFPHALDPKNPTSFGSYMNDPDLINNKYQLHLAMQSALKVLPEVFDSWAQLTGRQYKMVETYRLEDADVALFLLGSAADTGREIADKMREKGIKAGVISLHVLRPFPTEIIQNALRGVKALVIGERADSYGGNGGNLTHEIKAALKDDPANNTLIASRIYGLGGKDFYPEDAVAFFELAQQMLATGKVEVPFDYFGITTDTKAEPVISVPPLTEEETQSPVKVEVVGTELKVTVPPPRQMMGMTKRITPGHGACPGCGIFGALDNFFRGLSGHVVVLFQTGCGYVVTTGYPHSAHRVTFIHNLFQNGAATLAGVVESFEEKQKRGEIPADEKITFVMVSGDGGMDIGMGPAIGTALRNHHLIMLEYDNQGYMNTCSQLSYSTPYGHKTETSHVGEFGKGKWFHHKDTAQIFAATHIPYVFTAVESNPQDLWKKAAKAQWYAQNVGTVYGKLLIACPLNWASPDNLGTKIVQAAVDCNFFPLYEVERGITHITYNPEEKNKKTGVEEWLKMMGKTKHMLKDAELTAELQREIDRRWNRLKAMSEHPDL